MLSQPHAQMKQPWPGMSDESAHGRSEPGMSHPWAVVTTTLVGMSQWLAKMSQQKKVGCGGWDESDSGQWGYILSARHGEEAAVGNE